MYFWSNQTLKKNIKCIFGRLFWCIFFCWNLKQFDTLFAANRPMIVFHLTYLEEKTHKNFTKILHKNQLQYIECWEYSCCCYYCVRIFPFLYQLEGTNRQLPPTNCKLQILSAINIVLPEIFVSQNYFSPYIFLLNNFFSARFFSWSKIVVCQKILSKGIFFRQKNTKLTLRAQLLQPSAVVRKKQFVGRQFF